MPNPFFNVFGYKKIQNLKKLSKNRYLNILYYVSAKRKLVKSSFLVTRKLIAITDSKTIYIRFWLDCDKLVGD